MITVAPVREDEYREAGEAYAASWRFSHADVCDEAFLRAHTDERMERALRADREAGAVILLARVDGEAAGVAAIDVKGRELMRLYVAPRFLGKGVGQKLLEAIGGILDSKAEGHSTLWCSVLCVNARARRFYEKNGFACAGEIRVLDADRNLRELKYVRNE